MEKLSMTEYEPTSDGLDFADSATLDGEESDPVASPEGSSGQSAILEDIKSTKVAAKTAKHQSKVTLITQKELENLETVIHPNKVAHADRRRQNGQGLLNNMTIERNVAFNKSVTKFSACLMIAGDVKEIEDEDKIVIEKAIQRLGVNPSPNFGNKARRHLCAKLLAAIQEDLLKVFNDEQETMQREGGYYRYVNRRTYNMMVRKAEIWDWATGQKLPEIQDTDVEDLDSDTAVDESRKGSDMNRSSSLLATSEGSDAVDNAEGDSKAADQFTELSLSSKFKDVAACRSEYIRGFAPDLAPFTPAQSRHRGLNVNTSSGTGSSLGTLPSHLTTLPSHPAPHHHPTR